MNADDPKLESFIFKLRRLEEKISQSGGILLPIDSVEFWEEVFELIEEIKEDFKTIRFPTRQERDEAWQYFFELQNSAYQKRRYWRDNISHNHLRDVIYKLELTKYDAFGAGLSEYLSMGLLKQAKEEIFMLQDKLKEAIQYYNEVKSEMNKTDKEKVREKIEEVKQSYDAFWGIYKERQSEAHQAFLQRREEKREKILTNLNENIDKLASANERRSRYIANIQKNEDKLENAEAALERKETNRDDLQEKINDSTNSRWIEQAEEWLEEHEQEIKNIEASIDRIKGWIQEEEERLESVETYISRLETWIEQGKDQLSNLGD